MPEHNLNLNSETFFEKFYKHLKIDSAVALTENGKKNEGYQLLSTYKYIYKTATDWTGPLNYFRNLPFYRVKKNCSVR